MLVPFILLYIIAGLDLSRRNEWHSAQPKLWLQIAHIGFDIIYTPIGMILDLIKEFRNEETTNNQQ